MTQTEQELDELVKRLGIKMEAKFTAYGALVVTGNPNGPEAATVIQSLRAELSSAKATIERLEHAALTSYRTRTGIDLADVSEKLASGEWVLSKKDPERLSVGAAPFTTY